LEPRSRELFFDNIQPHHGPAPGFAVGGLDDDALGVAANGTENGDGLTEVAIPGVVCDGESGAGLEFSKSGERIAEAIFFCVQKSLSSLLRNPFSLDVESEILNVLKRPTVGCVFSLFWMESEVIPAEMVEFVGKEGSQMIEERMILKLPSVTVSLCFRKRTSVSIEAQPDEFEPLGKVGRYSPVLDKCPFASIGKKVGGSYPVSDVCSPTFAPVREDVECHDEIVGIRGFYNLAQGLKNFFTADGCFLKKARIGEEVYFHDGFVFFVSVMM